MTSKIMFTTLLTTCSVILSACGEDVSEKPSNADPSEPANASAGSTLGDGSGDPETTRFDVEIGEGGVKTPIQGEIQNQAASKESSGAAIAGSAVEIFLVSGQTLISATVETSEAKTAPGSFAISAPPDGSHVTFFDPVNGTILESLEGTIVLQSCPTKVGEKVVGKFSDVKLASNFGNATKTLEGTFDLRVFAKAGDLFCRPPKSPEANAEPEEREPDEQSGGTCAWDQCLNDGVCCPYRSCMSQCEESCIFDPACLQNPLACAQCAEACLDTCDVSTNCRQALGNLTSCDTQYGCSEREGQEEACMLERCCDELQAAF
jgi:hypothetical protein